MAQEQLLKMALNDLNTRSASGALQCGVQMVTPKITQAMI